ncbi:hypothetical protein B0H63DRAFT_401591 [Podospora didyma]|uniref:Eukaryotic translation initiation factor 3 subunit M n=1 Tax=Podospora didyma TaxID=330526 RepID=A0AAE0N700_9PEZI|nr:hypothetical protein B0H63DRAFT_401591 [Podospora didyma]
MASGAGQGNSVVAGVKQPEVEVSVKPKKTKPPVRTLPPGPLSPLKDTVSPPAILKSKKDSTSTPVSFCSPTRLSDHPEYFSSVHVKAVLNGASARLRSFATQHLPPDIAKPIAIMAAPQLIFVDGSFEELAQEMADYILVGDQVKPLLEKEQKEEALAVIVKASSFLNSVPEKEFTAAYNLLIHLVLKAKEPKKFLPSVCQNLLKPITSSPTHSFTLASNALSTVFNLLDQNNPLRYNVLMQIIRFIRQHGQFELLKPRLKNLDLWFDEWETDEEDQRKLYVDVADAAKEAGDEEESYRFVLKALGTFDRDDQEEITSEEAKTLSLRAGRMAISSPSRFDFQDLRSLPAVQALSDSEPMYAQLLDIFTEQDLEDYNDFREEHEGWIEKEKLDHEKLQRKMRLLTFASLAASTPNREIPYANIARALQIPSEEVEMWTIDVIRAKLVEGRLSQKQRVFLVHRTTYRVFGEKQWRELGTRVDQFKTVLDRLIVVVRKAQADVDSQKEREQQELDRKMANAGISIGTGGEGRRRLQLTQKQRTDDDD